MLGTFLARRLVAAAGLAAGLLGASWLAGLPSSAGVADKPLLPRDCPSGQLNSGEPTYAEGSRSSATPDDLVARWTQQRSGVEEFGSTLSLRALSDRQQVAAVTNPAGRVIAKVTLINEGQGWRISQVQECSP